MAICAPKCMLYTSRLAAITLYYLVKVGMSAYFIVMVIFTTVFLKIVKILNDGSGVSVLDLMVSLNY